MTASPQRTVIDPDADAATNTRAVLQHIEASEEAADAEPKAAPEAGRRAAKAVRAVRYIEPWVSSWYADPDGEPYMDVTLKGVRRTLRVRSRQTRALLDRAMWDGEGVALGSQARQDALDVLDARARHSGVTRDVHVRIAEHEGDVWLDLGDDSWRAIRVTADGWSLVDSIDVPVRYRRPRGLRALQTPVRGGSLEELRRYVHAGGDMYILLVAWLIGALRPRGPYVVLAISGEQGSAKSTAARLLRALIDPHEVPHRGPPRDDRDVAIAAANAHVVALDNLSYLPVWLSDALCRIATGGGYATRQLYTDGEECILSATRPIIITGIEDVATRGDLADRAYTVHLDRIADADRKTEAELDAAYQQAAPGLLGALLDAVACGLRREPELPRMVLPRMADAARWVVACEPACPWPAGAYLEAYQGVRDDMIAAGIAGDVVAAAVLEHMERHGKPTKTEGQREWEGTARELLNALNDARQGQSPPRRWPETERALSGRLTRAAPLLRGAGVEIGRRRDTDRARTRLIVLIQTGEAPDRPDRPDRPDPRRDAGYRADGDADGTDGERSADDDADGRSPAPSARIPSNGAGSDRADGADGRSPTLSMSPHERELWDRYRAYQREGVSDPRNATLDSYRDRAATGVVLDDLIERIAIQEES